MRIKKSKLNRIIKEEIQEEVMTIEEKKRERRNNIYKNILTTLKEVNPLKTYRVWTYIEIPNTSRNIQLSYRKMGIPVYFRKCIDIISVNIISSSSSEDITSFKPSG